MVSIEHDNEYNVYNAILDNGRICVSLASKQEVIDTLVEYGYTEIIDKTIAIRNN